MSGRPRTVEFAPALFIALFIPLGISLSLGKLVLGLPLLVTFAWYLGHPGLSPGHGE